MRKTPSRVARPRPEPPEMPVAVPSFEIAGLEDAGFEHAANDAAAEPEDRFSWIVTTPGDRFQVSAESYQVGAHGVHFLIGEARIAFFSHRVAVCRADCTPDIGGATDE